MKKMFLLLALVLIAGALVGCTDITPYEDEIAEHLETIALLEAEKETLLSEVGAVIIEKTEVEEEGVDLTETIVILETSVSEIEEELETAKKEKAKETLRAEEIYQLFMRDSGEELGNFIFCGAAYETEFAYIDKLSMRKELEDYEAASSDVNPDTITSSHQLIFSNMSDGIIKVFSGGYMYPFIVRFDSEDGWMKDSVYSLTSGCYIDYPALEEQVLAAYSKK